MLNGGHPHRRRGPHVASQIVQEDTPPRRHPEPPRGVPVDLRLRLAHPHLAGDDHLVEEAVPAGAVVGVAPGVGEQRHRRPRGAHPAHQLHHGAGHGERLEHALDQPLGGRPGAVRAAQRLRQRHLQLGHRHLTALHPVEDGGRRATGRTRTEVPGQQRVEGVGVHPVPRGPLGDPGVERLGQHTAPVDQQGARRTGRCTHHRHTPVVAARFPGRSLSPHDGSSA
ncbi:hypothetical protein SCATT_p09080 (plasmid) [Streptantibioticus cattleyicolor NRRL 8057 = DSM 46488]|uniref:Uncharacterized protein n=1 Tax=Streptantibioticus cattleyicolor (strain ATCC 35852 / DSM 46488 / JCM 4925 / NBRC 14057 / NRRL 8057) TaxID=1003195 RepID=G8XDF5_STREN|nr:hypothetical protein SCATT_p09080 [Streptantibioticus cattleyicolor NRRL 8057 = DSM 46488]